MTDADADDSPGLRDLVTAAVLADPVCAAVLDRAPSLGLDDWCLTGGAVFQNVWNAVTGRPPGWGIDDHDLFYTDPGDLSWEAEDRVIRSTTRVFADVDARVEARNQARVHLWYEERFGRPCRPLGSVREAVDSFVATTCCVAITRTRAGLEMYAPHGLADVVGLRLRPRRGSEAPEVYAAKAASYRSRWPELTVEPW